LPARQRFARPAVGGQKLLQPAKSKKSSCRKIFGPGPVRKISGKLFKKFQRSGNFSPQRPDRAVRQSLDGEGRGVHTWGDGEKIDGLSYPPKIHSQTGHTGGVAIHGGND
jgi:hypothetical protein